MFRSLRFYNYRLWFTGSIISNVGSWMQTTAQAWVVLTELTDGDAAAMGLAMALQHLPHILLVGLTGWVSDRVNRRILLIVTQVALGLIAATVGVLLLTDVLTLPIMYVLITGTGVVAAFDTPARQVMVTDIVAVEHAPNAIALNATTVNSARLMGPAAAGVLLAVTQSGWVFLINAGSFAAMILALVLLRTRELQPRARMAGAQGIADGLRYLRGRPDLMVVFAMVGLVGSFGVNLPIYASTMTLEFGYGPEGFGLLTSALAIGALGGALFAATRRRVVIPVIVVAAGGFGGAFAASAVMPDYWFYAAAIVVVGACMAVTTSMSNAYTQTTTDHALRGRVLALYMALIFGGGPAAALLLGWLASEFGARATSWAAGAAGLTALIIGSVWVLLGRRGGGRAANGPGARHAARPPSPPHDAEILPEDFSEFLAEAAAPLPDGEEPGPGAEGTAASDVR